MPLITERATSLAASSYTFLVGQSVLNTRSTAKRNEEGSEEGSKFCFLANVSVGIKAKYGLGRMVTLTKAIDHLQLPCTDTTRYITYYANFRQSRMVTSHLNKKYNIQD